VWSETSILQMTLRTCFSTVLTQEKRCTSAF
jgi:hypothetical protein